MADVGASDAFYFHYSSGGELIGYTYKTADAETECILVKNQQGDVERVIAADGTILASYAYDAWGNILTAEGSLAAANPIRYRGYYFDAETGLYYLQSRYYDPTVGRFINADAQVVAESSVGCNSFTYSLNNPVSMADDEGDLPFFVATAIAGAIIGAIVGGAVAAANGKNVWAGIGIGAAAGALIGTGAGMAAGAALAGSITATTGAVVHGAGALAAVVSSGGTGAGATYISNNITHASNSLAPASQEVAQNSFDTYRAMKKVLGPAGEGNQWHHIVEQCQIGKTGLSPQMVQSTNNIIAVSNTIHGKISGFYSSIQPFTNGMTVRNWLAGKSFETQYAFGLYVIRLFS